jgi:C-terminal processing protease CtpA/Prc
MSLIFSVRALLTALLCGLAAIADSSFGLGGVRSGAQFVMRLFDSIARWRWSATKGALVSRISAGSPAEKAGLQIGDVIVRFAGNKIHNTEQLRKFVAATKADIEARIDVLRAGRMQSFRVTLGAAPAMVPTSARTAEVMSNTQSCSTARTQAAANQDASDAPRSACQVQSR